MRRRIKHSHFLNFRFVFSFCVPRMSLLTEKFRSKATVSNFFQCNIWLVEMKRAVVVIGANRGIGLELARRFVGKGDRVYAVCRKANDEMRKSKFEKIAENVECLFRRL